MPNNDFTEDTLQNIYNKAITRKWLVSNLPTKNDALRRLLGMEEKHTILEIGCYDNEIAEEVANIDFGFVKNTCKSLYITYVKMVYIPMYSEMYHDTDVIGDVCNDNIV